jgi:hypothetical protein
VQGFELHRDLQSRVV